MIGTLILMLALQEGTVTPVEGPAVTGTISKDTSAGVTVKPKTGPPVEFKPDKVAKIEYADAPPTFREAMQRWDGGKHRDALDKFREADDWVKQIKEDQTKLPPPRFRDRYGEAKPPGKWFEPYSAFYKAECQRLTKDYVGGYDAYMKLIAEQKDFRMIRDAYQGAMRCLIDRAEPKEDEAKKLIDQASKESARLGDEFVKDLKGTYIELIVKLGNYQDAIKMYEELIASKDEEVQLKGVRGKMDCLNKGESADLDAFAENLLKTSPSNKVKVLAAAALGSRWIARAAKSNKAEDYRKAVPYLIDATMTFFPGVGKGVDADHEDALFDLAACYEKLAEIHQKANNRDGELLYLIEAVGAHRELIAAYPSSDRAPESNSKAEELDGRIGALQAAAPKNP